MNSGEKWTDHKPNMAAPRSPVQRKAAWRSGTVWASPNPSMSRQNATERSRSETIRCASNRSVMVTMASTASCCLWDLQRIA